jgi:hypothetical protein
VSRNNEEINRRAIGALMALAEAQTHICRFLDDNMGRYHEPNRKLILANMAMNRASGLLDEAMREAVK